MSATDGRWQGEEPPDLDLDHPAARDAPAIALFRDGLRPSYGSAPDLRAIERRARRQHRRRQALVSGAVTMAAAAAVTMVVSPWSSKSESRTVPTRPTPSATVTLTVPPLTKASLMRPEDLAQPTHGGAPYLGGETFGLADLEDVSGQKVRQNVCGDVGVLDVEAPDTGWRQIYVSQGDAEVSAWAVTETVLQWPGRPDLATAVRDQLRDAAVGCEADAGGEAPKRVTWSGEVNLPTLETAGTNSEGLTLASDVVVVGDTVVILDVGSAAGDLASRISVNTFSWLFPAVSRLVGEVPEPGEEGPLHRLPGEGNSVMPAPTGSGAVQ